MSLFSTRSFPRCILHIDGDGFFASCQQVMRAELRGKPVVTGRERGVITSASVEAKKLGIKRGVTPWDAKKICPELIFIDSDYESYELFSYRMLNILQKYTPEVEHYSIDECFVDLTGLRQVYRMSYPDLARKIKTEIQAALGLTVSVGISLNKTLAKVASRWQKPNGFTSIPGCEIHQFLAKTKLGNIWGIGLQTTARLNKLGLNTALDFASLPENKIHEEFEKPLYVIWRELRGHYDLTVHSGNPDIPKSLSKTHTFSQSTKDKNIIEQELLLNLEKAFWRLRSFNLRCKSITVTVKTQSFNIEGIEIRCNRHTAYESEVISQVRDTLNQLIKSDMEYRATGIHLGHLCPDDQLQSSLFEPLLTVEKKEKLYQGIDDLRRRYHKPVIRTGPLKLLTRDRQTLDLFQSGILLPVSPEKHAEFRLKFL
jgi:DNA polymerase IV